VQVNKKEKNKIITALMDPNSIFFIKTGFQGKIKVSALENIIRNYV